MLCFSSDIIHFINARESINKKTPKMSEKYLQILLVKFILKPKSDGIRRVRSHIIFYQYYK